MTSIVRTSASPRRGLFNAPAMLASVVVASALGACSKSEAPALATSASPAERTATGAAAPRVDATTKAAPTIAATTSAATEATHGAAPTDGHAAIAWRQAASDADVDAAFAAARSESKPVFVYWGAKWCPPCNQVKATLFNRQDFIERSRAFVPVYVDGDSPGAQRLGTRFRVSGYPTMLLFNAQGEEVTRLPGEAEPKRYDEALDLGMNAARPVKTLVAEAMAGKALAPSDWRLLASYSWDTDQKQILGTGKIDRTLAKLADACPASEGETAMRLRLKALAARDEKTTAVDAAPRAAVLALLGDPAAARAEGDMIVNYAPELAKALSAQGRPERAQVVAAFDAALERLAGDATLSRADRMQALISRVGLVRIDDPAEDAKKARAAPAMPAPLLAGIRAQVAAADSEITDGYERQAVITAAAYLLERAGLLAESDALLERNLAKSHSPYYLMSELASNAKKRGDDAAALRWYAKAFATSEGPATRLQWGASYLAALVDLAPADEATIERTAAGLWKEASTQPDAFEQRSERSLQKIGKKLVAWNAGGKHAASLRRLQSNLDAFCAARPAEEAKRAGCAAMLQPAAKRTA